MNYPRLYILCLLFMIAACHSKTETEESASEEEIITPVTVTTVGMDPMAEYIELNATSSYMQRAFVKANANGYIKSVNTAVGKTVSAGQIVFVLKTKEAQSIGNTINVLDTSFKFTGIINIPAGTSGYVAELDHQPGDYVQDGEQLAVISDASSFVFILNLPYELRPFVLNKGTVELLLPDGKSMTATIAAEMPIVDSASQTQNIILRVKERNLPTNLIAKVKITKVARDNAISLPKQSVLSDETQSSFWVMQVLDSATAIKVPVRKGIEMGDRVEILSPRFSVTDQFLLTGNFGLPDTAKIKIMQPQTEKD